MRVATFSVTCTQGSNSAKLSGEIYYEGYHTKVVSGSFEYYGQQYGFFNVSATKVSGGDFTARFKMFKAPDSINYIYENEGSLAALSTNGSNGVAWDTGPEYCVHIYDTFAGSTSTVRIYVRFYVDWGSGETYADSSTFSFNVPKEETRFLVFNGNGGTVVNGYGRAGFAPTSSFPSITISRHYPTRENYEFYRWSDTTDGSGSVSFTGGPGNEWDGSGANEAYSSSATQKTLYAIWNPLIKFDANGGLDDTIPASFYKTHNVASTVPNTMPLHVSKTFVSWNTAQDGNDTTFQRGATITADVNWPLTLYAQWRTPTASPTISSITVVRCDSSGTSNDLGTYAKITATWSVDRTYDSSNTGLVTGKYRVSGSSSTTSFSFSSGTAGVSGTATKILGGLDTDTQYEFIVEVQDSNSDSHHTSLVSKNVILTRAKFIMDLRAGGEGMGLFSAAPSDGLEVGKNTQIDGNLTVLGNITASNLSLTSESGSSVASASDDFTLSSAYGYKYGPIRMASITIAASAALTVGTNYTIGTLVSAYSVPRAIGFANQYGVGYVDGSTIYFKPLVSVSESTSLYVALTYIKP